MTKDFKLDPRTKLVIVLCLSTLAIVSKNTLFLFIVTLIALFTAKLFHIKISRNLKKIKRLIYMLLIIALVQSIFTEGEALLSIGQIKVLTITGIEKGTQFILRMAIVIFSAAIISTSNSREIIQGLVQLKLPYEIAFMAALGIRFLPMIREEIKDSLTAIQLRGVDIKKIPIKERLNLYSYLFTPILAGTMLKAERLSIAIEMRGFRAYDKRTSHFVLKLKKIDYLIMALAITTTIIFIYMEVLL